MKKKLVGIFVVMLLISSAMTAILFSNKTEVVASGGGQQGGGGVNLDYDWVWNRTEDFANVIHNVNWSENGENGIPKGRCWATAGENYTILKILWEHMGKPEFACGLTDYTNLSIGYVSGVNGLVPLTLLSKQYSSKIVIQDYGLTLQLENETKNIPYSELYPLGVGFIPIWKTEQYLNQNFSFTNATVIEKNLNNKDLSTEYLNVS